MTEIKVSELPEASQINNNDLIMIVQSGINKKITKDNSLNPLVEGKQDTLVSGTNIKTINNTSLLGSGNISIEGTEPENSYSTSTQDTYSCNYVNNLVEPCKVVTYDSEWIYGTNPTGLGGMVVDIPIYNPNKKTVTASFTSAQVFDGTSWLNLGTATVTATYTTHVLVSFGTSGLTLDAGKSWLLKLSGSVTVSNS